MKDERIVALAHNLIHYSVRLKKDENVLIETTDVDYSMITELIKEIYSIGAHPFVITNDSRVTRAMMMGMSDDQAKRMAEYDRTRMEHMQAYIGVRGTDNSFECGDVPSENTSTYARLYSHPIHHEIRVGKTKWVVLRYPTPSMAQAAGMSTDAFENYYFNVCNLDYSKMDNAMNALKKLMETTDRVRIVAPGTDLSFSIKGIPAIKCAGHMNIPDGEVYTAPVRNSVNGYISYNAPSVEQGIKFENVKLTFKDGKIIEDTSNFPLKSRAIFDTDEGARFVGEFALGVNPYITKPMGDILFDEKICGSLHFTPGASYEDAYNGNNSAVHWDLVLIQTKEYGGGEIYFDDKLIRKNGVFVVDDLKCLNPENLI